MLQEVRCSKCDGTGLFNPPYTAPCLECHGKGVVNVFIRPETPRGRTKECPRCLGKKEISACDGCGCMSLKHIHETKTCPECNGKGFVNAYVPSTKNGYTAKEALMWQIGDMGVPATPHTVFHLLGTNALGLIADFIMKRDEAKLAELAERQHTYNVTHSGGDAHEPYLAQAVPIEDVYKAFGKEY